MITVIIAGGSGTRLWPLSTPARPKQLLALTSDRTLVQQSYDRAAKLGDTTYVVTEASHADDLRSQLPELDEAAFLIEPGRRGTAHCILLALDYISRHHQPDEPVAFIHADHNIRDIDGFRRSIRLAAETAKQRQTISLVGIEPTYPATSFGYIERGEAIDQAGNVYAVRSFQEKPDHLTAQKYLATGNYLWNCGYFVGSVAIFQAAMSESAPELLAHYQTLSAITDHGSDEYKQQYLDFDNQVIDVALIEKAKYLAVVPASFDWMDIGSFKDLHDVVVKDEQGNYSQGEQVYALDTEGTYIRNEEPSKPVAVIGLDNVVVVNTPDGLLVARKDVSQRTGEVAKQLLAAERLAQERTE